MYTAEVTQLHSPESAWRWRNPVMQHSSFLGGSWAFRMHISRSDPNLRIRCSLQQAALPNPLEIGITNKQFKGNKLSEANRTNITQRQRWLASVSSAKTSTGTQHPPSCSCRKPGHCSWAEIRSTSSLLHCYHQENQGNAVNPRSGEQGG